MTIDEMLQHRDEVYLEWDEPWTSLPSDSETREVSVTCRATVDACIDIARLHEHQFGFDPPFDEAELLSDFIESYGAHVVGEPR